jgi:WD40 repeat protein
MRIFWGLPILALLLHGMLGNRGPAGAPIRVTPKPPYVGRVTFSPDGKYIFAECYQHFRNSSGYHFFTLLIDASKGKVLRKMLSGREPPCTVFLPDGKHAFSGSFWDENIGLYELATGKFPGLTLWNIQTGKPVRSFQSKPDQIRSLAVSRDGKLALSGHLDGRMLLWDVTTGKEVRSFPTKRSKVITSSESVDFVHFSTDGKQALSSTGNGSQVWDMVTGKQIKRAFVGDRKSGAKPFLHAYSLDGKRACSGRLRLEQRETVITVWDIQSGKAVRSFQEPYENQGGPLGIALSANGKHFLWASKRGTLRRLEISTGKQLWSVSLQNLGLGKGPLATVTFSPDGRRALVASPEGPFLLWDTEKRKQIWKIPEIKSHGR